MGLPGLNQTTKQRIKYLAQGQNAVALVKLEPSSPLSRVKHSTIEPALLKALWCVLEQENFIQNQ